MKEEMSEYRKRVEAINYILIRSRRDRLRYLRRIRALEEQLKQKDIFYKNTHD